MRRSSLMLSSYWTPSRQYIRPPVDGKPTRRLSITSNVSLAYSTGPEMTFALRSQNSDSSWSECEEDQNIASCATSSVEQVGLNAISSLIPQRQRAKRLTKMQGCYPPNAHMANSEDSIQQKSTNGKREQCKVLNLHVSLPPLPDQHVGRNHLRKLTGVSWKLKELQQVQAEEEARMPDLQQDFETGSFARTIQQLKLDAVAPAEQNEGHIDKQNESSSQSKDLPPLSSSKPSQVAIVDFSAQSAELSNHTHHHIPPAMKSVNGYCTDPNSSSSSSHLDEPTTGPSRGQHKLPVKECILLFNHPRHSSSTADNKMSPLKHCSRPAPKRVAPLSRRNSLNTAKGMKTTSSSHLPPLKSTPLVNSSSLKKVSFGSETLRVDSAKLHKAGNSQEITTLQQKKKIGSKKRKKTSVSVTPSSEDFPYPDPLSVSDPAYQHRLMSLREDVKATIKAEQVEKKKHHSSHQH